MADVEVPAPSAGDGTSKPRPERPDEGKYKADLAKAEKEHELKMKEFNAHKTKMDGARSTSKDSPGNDRFKTLVAEQKSIREQQSANKGTRTAQQEKYSAADNQIKTMIAEQKNSRSRMPYKNAEEIDAQIKHLEQQVDSGKMKLVEEKKALAEVSSLRKQKKGFTGLDDLQKRIDDKKAENAELRKTFDTQESRALSQKYEDNQKELDEIKAARDDTNKNYDSIKAEREKLNNEQKATWLKIKEIKDTYYQNRKAFKQHEDMIWEQKRERQKAERDAYEKEKRQRRAQEALEEAGNKAYGDEMRLIQSLLANLDPSTRNTEIVKDDSKFAATAQRTVDQSDLKGVKLMKKDEEDFFIGGPGKKRGKGKKAAASTPSEGGKYSLDFGTIKSFNELGIDPPTSQAEVPAIVEKLKEKLAFYKKDQDRQTQVNIEAAQKEIDRLEKEAAEPSSSSTDPKADGRRRDGRARKVPAKGAGTNGDLSADAELAQEKDAAADATEDMKKASIEDKADEPVEA